MWTGEQQSPSTRRSFVLPALVQIRREPRLYVCDGFATPEEMLHVLAVAEHVERSDDASAKRDATGFSFEMEVDGDPVLERIRARLEALLRMDNDVGETFRFRRYRGGESHPPHNDTYVIGESTLVVTALLHLHPVAEGGETEFPDARPEAARVAPRPGRLVVWFSHLPDGTEDPCAVHAGLPVVEGEKATLTAFVYKPLEFAATYLPCEPCTTDGEEDPCASTA